MKHMFCLRGITLRSGNYLLPMQWAATSVHDIGLRKSGRALYQPENARGSDQEIRKYTNKRIFVYFRNSDTGTA